MEFDVKTLQSLKYFFAAGKCGEYFTSLVHNGFALKVPDLHVGDTKYCVSTTLSIPQ